MVYNNWVVEDFNISYLKMRQDVRFIFGLDFGYQTSYNAFVAAAMEPTTRTLWIFDEMYERGMTNLDIAKKITAMGYSKEPIWADAAEPKSIVELQSGLIEERSMNGDREYIRYSLPNIRPAMKGPDSVTNGISKVQEFHIIIHPSCENFFKEITNFSWAKDKDGNLTGKPEKEFDHCLVAGTMIMTDHGEIPIEDVNVGDMVMTHLGYRPVTASGVTQHNQPIWRLELTNGKVLEGTWNHQIVTKKGVKYLKDVTSKDVLIGPKGLMSFSAFSGRLAPNEAFRHIGSECDDAYLSRGNYVAGVDMIQERYVGSVTKTGRTEDVYDLTVDEAHDFFANGILTLNCMDAIRYAVTGELHYAHGGVVEARGTDNLTPEEKKMEPISTLRNGPEITPAVSLIENHPEPLRKRVCRVFSSIRGE